MNAKVEVPFYPKSWTLYGSQLSPFCLKVAATLSFAGIPFRWHWQREGFFEFLKYETKVQLIKLGILRVHIPSVSSPLEEFPLVPFLFGEDGTTAYDSSHIASALWTSHNNCLSENKCLSFAVHLIEEFFDDWGLYVVHHKRWTGKGNNTDASKSAGNFVAVKEIGNMSGLPESLLALIGKGFDRRQTLRLGYLFSVAKQGNETKQRDDLPRSPTGNHPTSKLLDQSFELILSAVENVLKQRPFLFGNHPTVADCALFGQLNMNALIDIGTRMEMEENHPELIQWLDRIQTFTESFSRQKRSPRTLTVSRDTTDLASAVYGHTYEFDMDMETLFKPLLPLIRHIFQTYVPLMQQNEQAYIRYSKEGITTFNERAFWSNQAMFTGNLLFQKHKFTTVVKTFQVQTWRNLKYEYSRLTVKEKHDLSNALAVANLSRIMFASANYSSL